MSFRAKKRRVVRQLKKETLDKQEALTEALKIKTIEFEKAEKENTRSEKLARDEK